MSKLKQYLPYIIIIFALLGVFDAGYLTYEHYAKIIPPCSIHWWIDCGKVLNSSYSMFLGLIPLALIGLFQYLAETLLAVLYVLTKNVIFLKILRLFSAIGAIFSLYFVYLMIFVIKAICLYCFGSAIISFILFTLVYLQNKSEKVIHESSN